MLDMKITVTAEDLSAALNHLADALEKQRTEFSANMSIPQHDVSAATVPTTTAPTVPVQQPVPDISSTPVEPQPSVPTVVPTSAPQYTLEMIATAGTALVDAGKMEPLVALLQKFGVSSLVELNPGSYGAVAQELRALGAQI